MSFRRVEVSVPLDKHDEAERALEEKLRDFNPKHPQHLYEAAGDDFVTFHCNLHPNQVGEILHHIEKTAGIGVDYGLCTILNVAAAKPHPPHPQKLEEQLKAAGKVCHPTWMQKYGQNRMSVEEIHTAINGGNSCDFNFWCFLIGAAVIAGGGLATGSAVMVVAAMLISPLMGPILALTFGLTTQDHALAWSGAKNEFFAALVTLMFGIFVGLILVPLGENLHWPTGEMAGRGNFENFVVGVIFAVASGVIVGLGVTGGGINSLVGVAISASLLPPIVNCGMLLAYGLVGPMQTDVDEDLGKEPNESGHPGYTYGKCYSLQQNLVNCEFPGLTGFGPDDPKFKFGVDKNLLLTQGVWSMALYCMNVCVIGTICCITFHMKHLIPDPYDKLGHGWANPEHRGKIAAKKAHIKETHVRNLGVNQAGRNSNVELSKA